MDDYIAAAFANLGWVKWKTHHHDDADTALRQSRATWDALATTYPYPFQWLGVLPQLALLYQNKAAKDNTDHDKSELSTLNQLLLDTKQQQLPDDIEQPPTHSSCNYNVQAPQRLRHRRTNILVMQLRQQNKQATSK